jgi:hypothetical protein
MAPELKAMLALTLSTIAFFVVSFFAKRKLEEMDIPAGMTRNALVFSIALAASYAVAVIAGKLWP